MTPETKSRYNLATLETTEVKFWKIKTNKHKEHSLAETIDSLLPIFTCVTLIYSLNFSRPQIPEMRSQVSTLSLRLLSLEMYECPEYTGQEVKTCTVF